jgi:hypothetical protein
MSSYAVADPQKHEVIDLDTGEYLPAANLIGSDYGQVMQLRMVLLWLVRSLTISVADCGFDRYPAAARNRRRVQGRRIT